MKIKWIICPDYVLSAHDDDVHFISAEQLMRLYRVSPSECYVAMGDHRGHGRTRWVKHDTRSLPDNLPRLYPLKEGDYVEHKMLLEETHCWELK